MHIHSCDGIRPRGSIIVFPSFVWHRLLTKGTRYSLVIWNFYPFRDMSNEAKIDYYYSTPRMDV